MGGRTRRVLHLFPSFSSLENIVKREKGRWWKWPWLCRAAFMSLREDVAPASREEGRGRKGKKWGKEEKGKGRGWWCRSWSNSNSALHRIPRRRVGRDWGKRGIPGGEERGKEKDATPFEIVGVWPNDFEFYNIFGIETEKRKKGRKRGDQEKKRKGKKKKGRKVCPCRHLRHFPFHLCWSCFCSSPRTKEKREDRKGV